MNSDAAQGVKVKLREPLDIIWAKLNFTVSKFKIDGTLG